MLRFFVKFPPLVSFFQDMYRDLCGEFVCGCGSLNGLGPFSIHPFSYNIKFSHLLGVYIMVIGLSGVQFNL